MTVTGPKWLAIALSDASTSEVIGPKSNPKILGWARYLRGWWRTFFTDDDTPWCAVAVNAWLEQSGVRGTGTARARDFALWGQRCVGPVLGCVLVFSRPEGAHVGFYLGETATRYRVWGGNQNNSVGATWIDKRRLIDGGLRWPAELAVPMPRRIYLADDGAPLSQDEA